MVAACFVLGVHSAAHLNYCHELKNSHMDMFVLQDLYLEHAGLTAQIDFLIITPRRFFVLECKNLYGNIEVNEKGQFVRTFNGGRKEGIYSPIAQNQRHLELIRSMKRDNRGFIANFLVDKDFGDVYQSLVVLANPKTVLNDRRAKRDVRERLVRADQLIAKMKAINAKKGPGHDKAPKSIARRSAEWFLAQHKENRVDYAAKYRELSESAALEASQGMGVSSGGAASDEQAIMCPRCGAPMVLRTARQGARAGKQFYGCSNYPRCRGIVNVGD